MLALWLSILAVAPVSQDSAVDLDAYVRDTPRCLATTHCFGVHLHMVVTPEGAAQDVAWVRAQVEEADRHFALIAPHVVPTVGV